MQESNHAGGSRRRVPSLSGDRNDGHHSIVSEPVALIEHVQAGMKRLDARAPGHQAGDFTARDRRPVRLINRA
jgi:hypothetical protein